MAKTEQHHLDDDLAAAHHIVKGGLDGGACLWRDGKNDPKTGHYGQTSCCHRWQAHEAEKADATRRARYNLPAEEIRRRARRFREVPSVIGLPEQDGDWALDGPRRTIRARFRTVKPGENFKRAYLPWFNNAHHLIPVGLFHRTINQFAKSSEDPEALAKLIKLSLISPKLGNDRYNINHSSNMIILPMDRIIGKILLLPIHLMVRKRRKGLITDKHHREYDDKVSMRLKRALEPIKGKMSKKKCAIEIEPGKLKERLIGLSEELLAGLHEFGEDNPGDPIASAPLKSKVKTKKGSL